MTNEDYSGLKIANLMKQINIFNICKLHIYYIINLMFRVKNNTITEALENKFEIVHHHYPIQHSENNFTGTEKYFKVSKWAIT